MPTTRLQRTLPAAPAAVWRVLNDPYQQQRWWPKVRRIEEVDLDRFTQVLGTARGKGVRADFVILQREEEELLQWSQELEGSPFERLLEEAVTTFTLGPADGDDGAGVATRVTVELRQRLRGWSRLAPFLFKGAAKRQLGEALDGLQAAVGG